MIKREERLLEVSSRPSTLFRKVHTPGYDFHWSVIGGLLDDAPLAGAYGRFSAGGGDGFRVVVRGNCAATGADLLPVLSTPVDLYA